MINLISNVFISKGSLVFTTLFTLCLFMNPQARAQYPGGNYYTPTQQQQPTTESAQTAYPQQYEQAQPQQAQPTYQQPAQTSYQQSGYQASTSYGSASEIEKPPSKKEKSDHDQAVGNIGLAILGVMNMPIVAVELDEESGTYIPRLDEEADLSAPTIGLRYWIDKTFGVEAGLGLGMSEASIERLTATETVKSDLPSTTAFTFHLGVPIALLYSGHFVFEVVPIVNGGLSTGTVYGDPAIGNNWDVSSFLLQVGARVGAEIHFGFIGVEQLALQASLGFRLSYLTASAETTGYTENGSRLSLGTTVGSDPWDLFTENLSAIYYIF